MLAGYPLSLLHLLLCASHMRLFTISSKWRACLQAKAHYSNVKGTGARLSKNPENFQAPKGKFLNQNLLNSSTIPSPQTNFPSLTGSFIVLFSKIIKTLILNANTADTKQLSGPEKLPVL